MTDQIFDRETLLSSSGAFIGENVELSDMLTARERRVWMQEKLISSFHKPLVSFTLNIPGPVKVLPLVPDAFVSGIIRIEAELKKKGLSVAGRDLILNKTGLEAFWAVEAGTDELKAAMVFVEDASDLGRLFDIDVIGTDGKKASREDLDLPARTCLLCGRPAHACARSRTHTVEELTARIESILRKEFVHHGI